MSLPTPALKPVDARAGPSAYKENTSSAEALPLARYQMATQALSTSQGSRDCTDVFRLIGEEMNHVFYFYRVGVSVSVLPEGMPPKDSSPATPLPDRLGYASAVRRTEDSQGVSGVRVCLDGSDCLGPALGS